MTTEAVYAGNGIDTLRKWNGSAWSAPTATVDGTAGRAMPKAGAICVWATPNRLVAAGYATVTGGPNGAVSSPSHVYISEPGNPEAWMVTDSPTSSPPTYANSLQLSPGDGEKIQAVVAYQNMVLVFKETKFFQIYGESSDQTGSPTFLYHTIDTGIGLASSRGVCVGHDGVYFLAKSGVYRTTGGAPQLISGVLDPLFVGGLTSFYGGSMLAHANIANARMVWHEERIYLAIPTAGATNDRLLVFDPRYGWWSIYSIPASSLASFQIGSQPELVFGYATGTNDIGRHSSAYVTDAGQSFVGHASYAWWDMGSPDIKTIREFKTWGSGMLQVGFAKDFQSSARRLTAIDYTAGVDLFEDGTNPNDLFEDGSNLDDLFAAGVVLTPKPVRKSERGTVFSLRVTGYQGNAWTLERVTAHIRESEIASKMSVDG